MKRDGGEGAASGVDGGEGCETVVVDGNKVYQGEATNGSR